MMLSGVLDGTIPANVCIHHTLDFASLTLPPIHQSSKKDQGECLPTKVTMDCLRSIALDNRGSVLGQFLIQPILRIRTRRTKQVAASFSFLCFSTQQKNPTAHHCHRVSCPRPRKFSYSLPRGSVTLPDPSNTILQSLTEQNTPPETTPKHRTNVHDPSESAQSTGTNLLVFTDTTPATRPPQVLSHPKPESILQKRFRNLRDVPRHNLPLQLRLHARSPQIPLRPPIRSMHEIAPELSSPERRRPMSRPPPCPRQVLAQPVHPPSLPQRWSLRNSHPSQPTRTLQQRRPNGQPTDANKTIPIRTPHCVP